MCGFVGQIARGTGGEVGTDLVRAMQCLLNRGPDAGGTQRVSVGCWNAELGHRRLSIIDLDERSAQPFNRGTLTVLYNGELYNYLELRDELMALGEAFRTESDTEVIAAAYQRWGISAFDRFDGMFALALLDSERQTLLLARDAFGEKPLYVSAQRDRVVFGSTADAVVTLLGGAQPAVNPAFIEAFLTLGFVPAPLTVWRGIEKLSAGEYRELDLRTGSWTCGQVSAVDLLDATSRNGGAFDVTTFESILLESLDRRLRADVPLALLLSGGIDSAYIAALLRRRLDRQVVAVTIRDRIDSSEEVDRAAHVCRTLGIEHRVAQMPARPLADLIDDALPAMDEPIGDPAFPMLCELYAHVPPELRVVLTGDGADELFLSYSGYRRMLAPSDGMMATLAGMVAPAMVRAMSGTSVLRRRVAERLVMEAALDPGERFRLIATLAGWGRGRLGEWSASIMPTGTGPDALYRYSLTHELPEYLLVKADRASMQRSFESRTPYLSRDLLRYVLSCDPATVGLGQKRCLTDRLAALLGEDLSFTKRGFFASGQDQLHRVATDWHPAIRDAAPAALLDAAHDPGRLDALSYFRLYVLNTWLVMRCA